MSLFLVDQVSLIKVNLESKKDLFELMKQNESFSVVTESSPKTRYYTIDVKFKTLGVGAYMYVLDNTEGGFIVQINHKKGNGHLLAEIFKKDFTNIIISSEIIEVPNN